MRGAVRISELDIKYNRMNWTVFDFFKDYIMKHADSGGRWYAYIQRDEIYEFLWSDIGYVPSKKYLTALKAERYIING